MKKQIYLDYAAATPLDSRVLSAMKPYFSGYFHNPSASYLPARAARQKLEEARAAVANIIGARPGEVVFTAGATEANNLAVQGVMRAYPKAELRVGAIEHDSVLKPAELYGAQTIAVTALGLVDVSKLAKLVSPDTVLVSVMLVNNELGTIQSLAEIAGLVAQIRADRQKNKNGLPLYLHTDAAQAGNYLDLHVSSLGVDLMSVNGGKLYGPKQSGFLYIKAGVNLRALIYGGGQEKGLRSGTENLAAAVGLAKALEIAQTRRTKETRKTLELRNIFATLLQKSIKHAVINGQSKKNSPHLLSVTIPGTDNERLMMELDELGIQCGVSSACSASNEQPSHVLSAIGLSDKQIRSTLRFSLGRSITRQDITFTVDRLASLATQHR